MSDYGCGCEQCKAADRIMELSKEAATATPARLLEIEKEMFDLSAKIAGREP
jgi:hypothetical protein